MTKSHLFWLLSSLILLLFSVIKNTVLVDGQCLKDQRSHLLHLKNSLKFDLEQSTKLVQWNQEYDCCNWEGVGCDVAGRVTTLELSNESITSGADSLTSLFKLQYLERLDLDSNNFNHVPIPKAIANLTSLVSLSLSNSNFSGTIPTELENLLELSVINLSNNNFSGPVPQFQASKNLSYIDLGLNSLSGSLSSAHFKGLQSLEILDLRYNLLSGRFPSSLLKLPALGSITLSHNQFYGQIDEIPSGLSISGIQLRFLDLRSNQFNGSFPKFLFELKGLEALLLSSNSFSDTIQLETFKNLPNIDILHLSYNNLTVELPSNNSSLAKMVELRLAYCKLKTFPEMKSSTMLNLLDLSDNQITGEIPNWIWNMEYLYYLNVSINSFVGLQQPYSISARLGILDLHTNQLEGEVPILSSALRYVDFSKNNFSGPIPLELNSVDFMSLSENSLTGFIPNSICGPKILDLSKNFLIGTIPSCLVTNDTREVLNLAGNNLNGNIPDTFPTNCSLKTIDLGMNKLQGKLPKTLSDCTMLEVLNLGNNKIEDVFPCMFENSSSLQILILRSNNFHGELECFGYNYSWPQLQIIDIASNNFSGVLSSHFFSSLENMLTLDFTQKSSRAGFTSFMFSSISWYDYQFKARVVMKGVEFELQKILSIFTTINFSNNKFSGNIPESIGDLKGLYILDLSHNEITGEIPSSIGKLSNLGSLDLSRNQLTGEIPSALKDLTFLSYLNLSFNILTGKIPTGPQFQTYTVDSYVGNVGLCGFPLNVSCGDANNTGPSGMPVLSNKKEIDWMHIIASMGYVVGLGMFSVLLLFCERWRNKLFLQIDQLLVKVFGAK